MFKLLRAILTDLTLAESFIISTPNFVQPECFALSQGEPLAVLPTPAGITSSTLPTTGTTFELDPIFHSLTSFSLFGFLYIRGVDFEVECLPDKIKIIFN